MRVFFSLEINLSVCVFFVRKPTLSCMYSFYVSIILHSSRNCFCAFAAQRLGMGTSVLFLYPDGFTRQFISPGYTTPKSTRQQNRNKENRSCVQWLKVATQTDKRSRAKILVGVDDEISIYFSRTNHTCVCMYYTYISSSYCLFRIVDAFTCHIIDIYNSMGIDIR